MVSVPNLERPTDSPELERPAIFKRGKSFDLEVLPNWSNYIFSGTFVPRVVF